MTEGNKDFTEAKKVLNDLKVYAEEKIAKRNQTNMEAASVVQEMNLASQPEIVSDHLEAESALQPLGVTEEVKTDIVSAEVSAVGETQNSEVAPTPAPEISGTVETPAEEAAVFEPAPSPAPVPSEGIQPQGEEIAATPAPVPEVVEAVQVPAMETNGLTAMNADTSAVQAVEGVQQGQGETLATPMPEPVPEVASQENVPVPVPEVAETVQATAAGDIPAADNNFVQTGGTEATVGTPETMNAGETNGIPEVPASEPLEGTGVSTEVVAQSVEPQPSDIPQIEGIPEIVIPDVTPVPDSSTYQASATGAQASIADVTPAASDVNVVMPTGTTEQEANDQTLVVGPESFVQSR